MPNLTGFIAISLWPLVSLWLFTSRPIAQAAVISIFGSYLFLPVGVSFDLPAVPEINKVSLPNVIMLAFVIAFGSNKTRLIPSSRTARLLIIFLVVGPFLTVIYNPDRIFFGPTSLTGLRLYDSLAIVTEVFIGIIPFIIGRSLLGSPKGHRVILQTLLAFGLVYSLLMLFEIRFSPQIHNWVYGFFPHSFAQQVRFGGFRPVVFLGHGLIVAFFAMTAAVASAILLRSSKDKAQFPLAVATGYLGIVLFLCKSIGSMLYGLVLIPLVALVGPRVQLLVAVILTAIAIGYPILRGADLVPTQTLVDWAGSIDEDRADSLQYRFDNEDILLERAKERPLFGWGTWGRNRVYDPETGKDLSTTDGYWIIVLGSFGWVGYIATFGLLGWPILAIWHKRRHAPPELVTTGLCLMLAINIIELLPNSTLMPWTWLIAGALLGYAEKPVWTEDVDPWPSSTSEGPPRPRTIL